MHLTYTHIYVYSFVNGRVCKEKMRSNVNKHCCYRHHLEAVVAVTDCEFEVITNTESVQGV